MEIAIYALIGAVVLYVVVRIILRRIFPRET